MTHKNPYWPIQQELDRLAHEKAQRVDGDSAQIHAYAKSFQESLPTRFRSAELSDLLASIWNQKLVLYGDFHTLPACQKGALELARSILRYRRAGDFILALEAFHSEDDDAIDRFVAGKISEKYFLNSVQYYKNWGFNWRPYRALLDFARLRSFRVAGINAPRGSTMEQRDRAIAANLENLRQHNPNAIILCLIGEQHLADDHLPKRLKGCTRILTNVEHYRPRLALGCDFLRLGKDYFCQYNAPNWMKWLSYLAWQDATPRAAQASCRPPCAVITSLLLSLQTSSFLKLLNSCATSCSCRSKTSNSPASRC